MEKELGLAKGLFEEINAVLDKTVLPSLQTSRSKVDDVKSALIKLRDSLQALNNIPFVNLSLPGDETLGKLIEIADTLDARIGEVDGIAQQTATFVSDAAYLTGGDLTETRTHLQSLLDEVNTYDQKVKDWRQQVEDVSAALPGWITRAAIILTVFLLWFGLSQAGLILHGLSAWRGGDPWAVVREWRR
jgi:small-conductance mechanosensitive channel